MELVDILDLKSGGQKPCGFDSRLAHQNWTKIGIAAHQRRFFFGFAEQNPDVFRGRNRKRGSRRLHFLGF